MCKIATTENVYARVKNIAILDFSDFKKTANANITVKHRATELEKLLRFIRVLLRLRSDDGNLALLNNHHHETFRLRMRLK